MNVSKINLVAESTPKAVEKTSASDKKDFNEYLSTAVSTKNESSAKKTIDTNQPTRNANEKCIKSKKGTASADEDNGQGIEASAYIDSSNVINVENEAAEDANLLLTDETTDNDIGKEKNQVQDNPDVLIQIISSQSSTVQNFNKVSSYEGEKANNIVAIDNNTNENAHILSVQEIAKKFRTEKKSDDNTVSMDDLINELSQNVINSSIQNENSTTNGLTETVSNDLDHDIAQITSDLNQLMQNKNNGSINNDLLKRITDDLKRLEQNNKEDKTSNSEFLKNIINSITEITTQNSTQNINSSTATNDILDKLQELVSNKTFIKELNLNLKSKDNEVSKAVQLLVNDIKASIKASSQIKKIEETKDANIINEDNVSDSGADLIQEQSQNASIDTNSQKKSDLFSQVLSESKAVKEDSSAIIKKPQDLLDTISEKFKLIKLPDITELKVKLKPRELGDIVIKVSMEKGQINGNILADKKEVVAILQSNIETLKQELKNTNVNLNNISVSVSTDDKNNEKGNFNGEGFSGKQNKSNQNFIEALSEEENEDVNEVDGLNIIA